MKIIIALIIFSLIIIIHELGHFTFAKLNGICVEEFSLGLGPTIFGVKKGETKYSLKLLPFGGSCMMLGEDGDSTDPRSFNSKSALARFSVIFAGPFFNFVLAFVLALFVIGLGGADPAVIGTVEEGGGAYEAGLEPGDRITHLDGKRIYNYREISLYNMMNSRNPDVEVTYVRNGQKDTVTVHRKAVEEGYYILGITMTKDYKQNLPGIIKYSFLEVRYQIKSTFSSLAYLIRGRASLNDMSGPVGIVNMIGDTYEESLSYGALTVVLNLLSFSILLTANLGVMNLLPLPALDGGRILFILIEMIRGKRIDPEKEGIVHLVGLVMLLVLMVIIMGNDIRHIIQG